jgi:hypothetical protein
MENLENKATETPENANNVDTTSALEALETLKRLNDWANSNVSYLSAATEYARGYRDGVEQAMSSARFILTTTK